MHLRQIQAHAKVNWFKSDNVDEFIYNILNALFSITEADPTYWEQLSDIKNDLSSILAAAKHLEDKGIDDSQKLFAKIPDHQQKFGIAIFI